MGNSIFSPSFDEERLITSRLADFVVSHEIAHFWSGLDHSFLFDNALSEGLTQAMTFDYLDQRYGKNARLLDEDLEWLFKVDSLFDIHITDPNTLKNYRYNAQKYYQLTQMDFY